MNITGIGQFNSKPISFGKIVAVNDNEKCLETNPGDLENAKNALNKKGEDTFDRFYEAIDNASGESPVSLTVLPMDKDGRCVCLHVATLDEYGFYCSGIYDGYIVTDNYMNNLNATPELAEKCIAEGMKSAKPVMDHCPKSFTAKFGPGTYCIGDIFPMEADADRYGSGGSFDGYAYGHVLGTCSYKDGDSGEKIEMSSDNGIFGIVNMDKLDDSEVELAKEYGMIIEVKDGLTFEHDQPNGIFKIKYDGKELEIKDSFTLKDASKCAKDIAYEKILQHLRTMTGSANI